jgi:hypothetical protein
MDWNKTKLRIQIDNKTVRDIQLSKLNSIAKTKIGRSDELVVF